MIHKAAAVTLLLLMGTGCGKSAPAPEDESATKTVPGEKPAPAPKQKTVPRKAEPVQLPLDQRRYGEWTHLEWAERIKDLDPKGPQAAPAVAGLIALMLDHDVPNPTRTRAAILLGRMGKTAAAAVPAFRTLLAKYGRSNHPFDVEVTHWTIRGLATLGRESKAASPDLAKLVLDSKRPFVIRAACLEALAQIGDADARAVHALIKMLTHRFNRNVSKNDAKMLRGFAIDAVAFVGPPAAAAIPSLILLTRNEDETVRRKAASALGAMRGQARDAIAPLGDLLTQDDSPAVREAAANALAAIGDLGVPILKGLLEDNDVEVKRHAARCLGKIGVAAKPAVGELDFALDDPDGWVRLYAAESLWRITQKADRAVPAYVEELKNPNRQIRIKAYRLLRELGPKAQSGSIALKKLLTDERPYVRAVARRALRNLESAR